MALEDDHVTLRSRSRDDHHAHFLSDGTRINTAEGAWDSGLFLWKRVTAPPAPLQQTLDPPPGMRG